MLASGVGLGLELGHMRQIDIDKEIKHTNKTFGVWARPVKRVIKYEDGSMELQRGYAVSHGKRVETFVCMADAHITAATAWRRCKRWLEGAC